ncbi:hypothetical protein WN51_10782 [Melipona quadrifasciata]|uniref:Uncharacterized protein n=1 Tax=Melipona quadrifasciata TaxID=166423 RepID=A0A0M9A5K9_9HYME|nr:hypothetical protein WN51_10782 [Melipona quadrifasciata]
MAAVSRINSVILARVTQKIGPLQVQMQRKLAIDFTFLHLSRIDNVEQSWLTGGPCPHFLVASATPSTASISPLACIKVPRNDEYLKYCKVKFFALYSTHHEDQTCQKNHKNHWKMAEMNKWHRRSWEAKDARPISRSSSSAVELATLAWHRVFLTWKVQNGTWSDHLKVIPQTYLNIPFPELRDGIGKKYTFPTFTEHADSNKQILTTSLTCHCYNLRWWKIREKRCSVLAKLVKRYLSVPASASFGNLEEGSFEIISYRIGIDKTCNVCLCPMISGSYDSLTIFVSHPVVPIQTGFAPQHY